MDMHEAGAAPAPRDPLDSDHSARPTGWLVPGGPDGSDRCAACDSALGDRYGWCSGCRMALCFACGRRHYCRPTCAANGCFAGLCVREVRDAALSDRWGLPSD